MQFNTCRLCKDDDLDRPLLRYGIRHYCHAECGFAKWGAEFLNKIPAHEVGMIPYRLILDFPDRLELAQKLAPCERVRSYKVSPEWEKSMNWLQANSARLKPDSTQ
jgi:hypothetical protein